ncbi:MAG: pyridoxamine 5'-phosphate oxidase family protein [Myxococcales bacterium]
MPEIQKRQASIERLSELIKGIRFAMLTTVGEHGVLHSRPMYTQEMNEDGELWFFTYSDSLKVSEVEHDQHVNVSYADPDKNRWVSVAGRARVVRDRAKMESLWRPTLRAWFPKGLEDPNIALLRVQVESAEFWDHPSGRMVQLIGLARALVTGKSASDVFEVGHLELTDQPGS